MTRLPHIEPIDTRPLEQAMAILDQWETTEMAHERTKAKLAERIYSDALDPYAIARDLTPHERVRYLRSELDYVNRTIQGYVARKDHIIKQLRELEQV